jgi:excisionase family DNA binding protein
MISGNEVLTAKQVSQILHLHPSTIYKLTRQGKIPGFRIGSDWRFRADVIERWIEAQSTDVSH